jgi:hypothetical protein
MSKFFIVFFLLCSSPAGAMDIGEENDFSEFSHTIDMKDDDIEDSEESESDVENNDIKKEYEEIEESDSFENLSNYSEETIKQANDACEYEQYEEFEKLKTPLEYAAKKRYKYSLSKYALFILGNLVNSKKKIQKLYKACDFLLMGVYRGDDYAFEYLKEIEYNLLCLVSSVIGR